MFNISPAAHLMRVLLVGDVLVMLFLAAFFLRSRKLSTLAYLGWGVVAILLPVLGPFLVIWVSPGKKRDRRSNLAQSAP